MDKWDFEKYRGKIKNIDKPEDKLKKVWQDIKENKISFGQFKILIKDLNHD